MAWLKRSTKVLITSSKHIKNKQFLTFTVFFLYNKLNGKLNGSFEVVMYFLLHVDMNNRKISIHYLPSVKTDAKEPID